MRDEPDARAADTYEIRVRGILDPRWSRWFEGMRVSPLSGGETAIVGKLVDQAALQGLLARIGDLGLKILLVRRLEEEDEE